MTQNNSILGHSLLFYDFTNNIITQKLFTDLPQCFFCINSVNLCSNMRVNALSFKIFIKRVQNITFHFKNICFMPKNYHHIYCYSKYGSYIRLLLLNSVSRDRIPPHHLSFIFFRFVLSLYLC